MFALLAVYFLVGLIVCLADANKASRSKRRSASLFALENLLFLSLWPLFVLVSLIERSQPAESDEPSTESQTSEDVLGMSGVVTFDLRPVGKVQIGKQLHEARASEYLGAGQKIVVVGRRSGELLVEIAPVGS